MLGGDLNLGIHDSMKRRFDPVAVPHHLQPGEKVVVMCLHPAVCSLLQSLVPTWFLRQMISSTLLNVGAKRASGTLTC